MNFRFLEILTLSFFISLFFTFPIYGATEEYCENNFENCKIIGEKQCQGDSKCISSNYDSCMQTLAQCIAGVKAEEEAAKKAGNGTGGNDCAIQYQTCLKACNGNSNCINECDGEAINCGAANPSFEGSNSGGKLNLVPKKFGESAGYNTAESSSPTLIIAKVIRGFLALAGIIMVVLTVYGGFLWMTAQGESEQVTKAKRVIVQAVIGLVIILLSFAIAQFVVNALTTAVVN